MTTQVPAIQFQAPALKVVRFARFSNQMIMTDGIIKALLDNKGLYAKFATALNSGDEKTVINFLKQEKNAKPFMQILLAEMLQSEGIIMELVKSYALSSSSAIAVLMDKMIAISIRGGNMHTMKPEHAAEFIFALLKAHERVLAQTKGIPDQSLLQLATEFLRSLTPAEQLGLVPLIKDTNYQIYIMQGVPVRKVNEYKTVTINRLYESLLKNDKVTKDAKAWISRGIGQYI